MGSNAASDPVSDLSNDILLLHLPLPPDEKWITHVETKFPGLKVRWVMRPNPDFTPIVLPEEVFEGVTMICSLTPHPAEMLPKVRYVQVASSGADLWLNHPLYQNPNVIFCTANGTTPPQIAEWVIGTWLMMGHHFLAYHAQQQEAKFNRLLHLNVEDAPGKRMGILGYGAIGRQCAKLAQALGMEVFAYTRSERSTPESRRDDSYVVPGTGDPEGLIPTKWFHGASSEAVDTFLAQDLDILVLSLPLTESSRRIIGPDQFEILARNKTFVSNIARGAHIDTDALLDALVTGKIRGAALDVTDPEPLPDGHPLFTAPNVFISPHVAWQTPHYFQRVQAIIERNLEGLLGNGKMINVMNREHHY
ncbi:hypothetical protein B0T22DRAFT_177400 [Podospora appendiculata]|uniref:D-isomer specific 2-hydroxyacid dehydrogenase NAD-binding domain-containing protein n=1 Tax=Podospora appendiculata TaxID=314037 RepID=A0AAE0XBR9_9PEZI|nr:hypothetical protein B0T22DRAFT_177400 [Podospora appendiculata]